MLALHETPFDLIRHKAVVDLHSCEVKVGMLSLDSLSLVSSHHERRHLRNLLYQHEFQTTNRG
jgi:hypothetical protein